MKKTMILLLLAVTVTLQSQTMGEFAVHKFSLQLDAYEYSVTITESGKSRVHTLVVPDYYDIHLVKSKVNRLVNEFSDVKYIVAWKYQQEDDNFMCGIKFVDLILTIGYSDQAKLFFIIYDKYQGEKKV